MMENHMNNYPLTKPREPSLLLDLQNNLIRIHRNTLSLLGNPEYIQILVNPDTALIAIRGCNKDDYRSERIRWDTLRDNNKSCEFYSKSLIKTIRKSSLMRLRCYHTEDDNWLLIRNRFCLSDLCFE